MTNTETIDAWFRKYEAWPSFEAGRSKIETEAKTLKWTSFQACESAKDAAFLLFEGYGATAGGSAIAFLKQRYKRTKLSTVGQFAPRLPNQKHKLPLYQYGTAAYWQVLGDVFITLCLYIEWAKDGGADATIENILLTVAKSNELLGVAKTIAAISGDKTAAQVLSKLGTDAAHANNRAKKQEAFAWLTKNPPKPRGKANAARHIAKHYFVTEDTGKVWVKEWEKKGVASSKTPILPITPTGTTPK